MKIVRCTRLTTDVHDQRDLQPIHRVSQSGGHYDDVHVQDGTTPTTSDRQAHVRRTLPHGRKHLMKISILARYSRISGVTIRQAKGYRCSRTVDSIGGYFRFSRYGILYLRATCDDLVSIKNVHRAVWITIVHVVGGGNSDS